MFKLMEMPNEDELKRKERTLFYGRDMEDYVTNSTYNDWCRFYFPNGVKEKLNKDTMYKVWFDFKDASDPSDFSCSYDIKYIEEVPNDVVNSFDLWKKNEKIVRDYLRE